MTARKRPSSSRKKIPRIAVDSDSLFVFEDGTRYFKNVNMKPVEQLTEQKDDDIIYQKAKEDDRHIFTGNFRHFSKLPKSSKDVGVIGHPQPITGGAGENIKRLFSSSSHEYFYGKAIKVGKDRIEIKRDCSKR